jgi:hypothetical protein
MVDIQRVEINPFLTARFIRDIDGLRVFYFMLEQVAGQRVFRRTRRNYERFRDIAQEVCDQLVIINPAIRCLAKADLDRFSNVLFNMYAPPSEPRRQVSGAH